MVVVDAGGEYRYLFPSSCHIVLVQVESSIASNLLQRIFGERSGKTMFYLSDKLNVDHRPDSLAS